MGYGLWAMEGYFQPASILNGFHRNNETRMPNESIVHLKWTSEMNQRECQIFTYIYHSLVFEH